METIEELKKPGPWGVGLKWGIIGGIVIVLISYIASMGVDWSDPELLEKSGKRWSQYLGYLILALIIVVAQIEHRNKELGGFMGYGRAVGIATITALGAGICMAIYMFVFFGILHPEFQQLIIENALSKMNDLPSGQEDQVISMMKMTTSPAAMALFTFIGNVFVGLVAGLITGIFTHKVEA
ncbi:MAG: DUF4199 family protein [Bacteroidetes bacterium]|nr:DUF4199 family protein [Bacteroidota bacterium]